MDLRSWWAQEKKLQLAGDFQNNHTEKWMGLGGGLGVAARFNQHTVPLHGMAVWLPSHSPTYADTMATNSSRNPTKLS